MREAPEYWEALKKAAASQPLREGWMRRLVRRWSAWAWRPEAEVAEGVDWLAENGASLRCVSLGPFLQGYVVIGDDGEACGNAYTPESALKEAMKGANVQAD